MKRERERRMELTQTTHSHSQCERVRSFGCIYLFVFAMSKKFASIAKFINCISKISCDMKSKLVHAEMQTFERKRE